MIDFTNAIEEFNKYKGSEKKKTLIYDSKRYLVKFPDPIREKNKNISYINNAYSEYVGSNIFRIVGFKVQNTILGKYKYNGNDKIVCACEDFTDEENELYEFESIALSSNPDKKIGTEVEDIMEVIKTNKMICSDTSKMFWKMFIIDALIGNTDRHNGNWGFLINVKTQKIEFSPIYDCGSCLNPLLEDTEIEKLDEIAIKNLAINCYSCLRENGKRINYINYIKKMKNKECNDAIKEIFLDIKINEINKFIDEIEGISNIRKAFYKSIINYRYICIKDVYEIIIS
ncbi:MAG: HipA domain-containing protein [Christensenellales bacterium]